MSEVKKVYTAMQAVAAELSQLGIEKERKNQAQGFQFRGIDDVLQALSPILRKHKLLMLPTQLERTVERVTTAKGTPMNHVTILMEYKLISSEDESFEVIRMGGEAMDSGDKGSSKAQSMSYKYACFQAFCIPFEGCDDPDGDSPEIGKAPAPGVKQDKAPAAAPAPKAPEPPKADGFIDEKQRKAIKEASLATLKTADQVSAWFKAKGIESFGKIKASQYDALLAEVKRAKSNGAAA